MAENKLLNNNEIDNEKEKLKQEIKKLYIYNNCFYNYGLDRLLCYFPNRATEIRECFCCKEEGKNVLPQDKKGQLQKIIMDELCSLLYPCIEKGYKVKQLDDSFYSTNLGTVICLERPNSEQYIGISIGQCSKTVSTKATFCDERDDGQLKPNFAPQSGIQISHNYKDNKFHNEITIFDFDRDYAFIIYPDTNTIELADFMENTKYATFCDKSNEIFKNKEEIIHFFSTLSFAEIEQVLQILNKDLENFNIKTLLIKIKNTIKNNRLQKQENREEIDSKSENSIVKPQLEIEKENETSCNCCITCLKQCWPFSEKEK